VDHNGVESDGKSGTLTDELMDSCRLLCQAIAEVDPGGDVKLPREAAGEIARQLEMAACTIMGYRVLESLEIDRPDTAGGDEPPAATRKHLAAAYTRGVRPTGTTSSIHMTMSLGVNRTDNPFIALHDYAVEAHWCLTWPCTTCAAQDLRSELTKWFALDPDSALNAARKLDSDIVDNLKEGRHFFTIAHAVASGFRNRDYGRFPEIFFHHIPEGGSFITALLNLPAPRGTLRAVVDPNKQSQYEAIEASLPPNPHVDDFAYYANDEPE
jgi:hypothetical protein